MLAQQNEKLWQEGLWESKEMPGASILESILQNGLKPFVKRIDEEGYYHQEFLRGLGKAGFFRSEGWNSANVLNREINLVGETAKYCMTTAFNIWCHLASLTYIRLTENTDLRNRMLTRLENGEILGATGLGNPMKYYAGLEKLHLTAVGVEGGWLISGTLPAVSNMGADNWFGVIAQVNDDQRIMAYVPGNAENLTLKPKMEYLGLNGSATYTCQFDNVFVPNGDIISVDADTFVPSIRPYFVAYQIPLAIGVTEAAIDSIEQASDKQGGSNQFLPIQGRDLLEGLQTLRTDFDRLTNQDDWKSQWMSLLNLRLQGVELTATAVHANMLHQGGSAYLMTSGPSRRLREFYFLANLTPTVRHLGKMLG